MKNAVSVITNRDLALLYVTAFEGFGGWRRNAAATDEAVRKVMNDIVRREIEKAEARP